MRARDQKIARLVIGKVYAGETTYREVGQQFGLTGERIRQIARKEGVWRTTADYLTPTELTRAASLVKRGMPIKHVGESIGRGCVHLARRLAARGAYTISPIAPPWTAAEIGILRRSYDKMPVRILAQRLGRTRNEVIGKANRIGLQSGRGPGSAKSAQQRASA